MEAKDTAQAELAYYAGLFDGEGCIHIARIKTKKRKLSYQLVCRVSMCSLPVLGQLKGLFDGSIHQEREHPIFNRYASLWSWSVFANGAEAFLNQIKPYLQIKRLQNEPIKRS